jgi:hypothetical protein
MLKWISEMGSDFVPCLIKSATHDLQSFRPKGGTLNECSGSHCIIGRGALGIGGAPLHVLSVRSQKGMEANAWVRKSVPLNTMS